MNTEKITDKIKHMLAIAHDPSSSEAEREQAMNKAHSLMLKHGIEVAHEDHTSGGAQYGHRKIFIKGVYAEAQAQMMYYVALAYKSYDMVMSKLPGTSSLDLFIAGPEEQMDEIMKILESLIDQSTTERKAWASNVLRGLPRNEQKKQIKYFYLGYGHKVAKRIEAILETETHTQDRQALVLVRDKATNYLDNMLNVNRDKKQRSRQVVNNAFIVGSMAGERAKLHNQLA